MIYDCFTFNEEYDLLRVRLEMMNDIVDKFVLVEMSKTHRGETKKCNFLEHRDEYKEFLDKIIYVCPDEKDIPDNKDEKDWSIEHFQRNCISLGLKDAKPDDIIIVSDLDEIPNPDIFYHPKEQTYSKIFGAGLKHTIKNFSNVKPGVLFAKRNLHSLLKYGPVACKQIVYCYFLNCKSDEKWFGSVICKYKNMKSPQWLRSNRGEVPFIDHGGWHLTFFGGVEKINNKIKNVVDNRDAIIDVARKFKNNYEYIDDCVKNGRDIYNKDLLFKYIKYEDIEFPNKELIIKKYPHFYRNL